VRVTLAMQRMFLWASACGLPSVAHAEWLAQWNSELWYVHSEGAARGETWRFAFGSLQDSVFIRRYLPEESLYLTHSPVGCLVTMALLNAALRCLALPFPPSRGILATVLHGHVLGDSFQLERHLRSSATASTVSGTDLYGIHCSHEDPLRIAVISVR
jgi:hypothetical protein